jgi:heme-degrading monooxygenase HmoA
MAMRGYRGLLAAVVLTVGSTLAWAQQPADYVRDYRELLQRSKAIAESLLQSSSEITKLLDEANPESIKKYFDERIAAIEKAAKAYDKNSDVWNKLTKLDGLIKDQLVRSREKLKTDGRYKDVVIKWESNERNAIGVRTDLEKEADRAKRLVVSLKEDRDLISDLMLAGAVGDALEKAKEAVKGLREMNGNMQKMVDGLNTKLKEGLVP